MVRNPETAYLVSNEEFDKQLEELGWSPSDMVTMAGMYIDRGMYNMKKSIRDFFREILELLFQAAALVIDTVRTFFLVVLAILGPIAFALSVWDGFQNTLTQWICRYIQVYLWLPVSDMFSTILAKIQVLMLQNDIERMQADPNFSLDSSDGVYIVFLCIGIIGYFYHSHRCGLDYPSRRHGRLRSQREPDGGTSRKHGGQRGGCSRRKRSRTCRQIAEIINVQS